MKEVLSVKVWGDLACFTRPENKVERVSYPLMTPSAARGVLEAIFWQPGFHWEVRAIWVLRPPRFISLMRNEVNNRASPTRILYADEEEERAQRHTLALRDVAYIVEAEMVPAPGSREPLAKFRDQFRRRVEKGQCYFPPYLGCREFTASFGPVEGDESPVDWTEDLGQMLFDIDYSPTGGRQTPMFFHARIERGILNIPPHLYQRLRWCHAPPASG